MGGALIDMLICGLLYNITQNSLHGDTISSTLISVVSEIEQGASRVQSECSASEPNPRTISDPRGKETAVQRGQHGTRTG